MNKTEPKQQEPYEPPEVRDYTPFTIRGSGTGESVKQPGDENYGDDF